MMLMQRGRRSRTRWMMMMQWRHLPHGVSGHSVEEVGPVLAARPKFAPTYMCPREHDGALAHVTRHRGEGQLQDQSRT